MSEVRASFVNTFRSAQRGWLGREIVPAGAYSFVWYADIIGRQTNEVGSSGGCAFAADPSTREVDDWRDALLQLASSLNLDGPLLRVFTEDTHKYLSSGQARCEANARLVEALAKDRVRGRPLIVVAHSMGGIVSFASLKQNAEQLDPADRLRVLRLVTMGTQVGQELVLKGLYGSFVSKPFPLPRTISEWVNILNAGDKLAFSTSGAFAATDTARLPKDWQINTSGDRHAVESYLKDRTVLRAILTPWCAAVTGAARPAECATVLAGP
jgi:hypothetical protein